MHKLNRNQGIAVFAGVGVMIYLFFSGPLLRLFSAPAAESPFNTNNTTTQMQSGFSAKDVVVGGGALAEKGTIVTAHYAGKLTNGQVFDSSYDRNTPIKFILGAGQVIRGWDEGLVGMREGGKRVLTIAPDYGYGAQAVGAIPANSVLVFEIELVDVEKPQ